MVASKNIAFELESHRRSLGMSCAALAKRSGLSLRTVQRVLSGTEPRASLSAVVRIAAAMEGSIALQFSDANQTRRRAAEQKAERLVDLVQGTMGLEAQAVDARTLAELRQRTVRDLLRGSSRRLWDE
jgi:hypothetical protein